MSADRKPPSTTCQEPRGWCYDPLGLTAYGHRDGCLGHPTWGQHCSHSEDVCCVCENNPCERVDVSFALAHEQRTAKQRERWVEQAMEYAMTHGHREPDPFDVAETCPPTCRATVGKASSSTSQSVTE